YKAMKRYEEGLESMEKVLELAISPNTAFYYGRKADLHDLANQPSAAAKSYLRSFQFETIPLHYYSLAVVYDKKIERCAQCPAVFPAVCRTTAAGRSANLLGLCPATH